MKNKIKTFLAIIVGLSAASALADQVYTTGTWGPYEYNPGGEFTLGVRTPGAAGCRQSSWCESIDLAGLELLRARCHCERDREPR
ncbi:exported hypothetical protein [Verrucomicrobia bacterium]|nr:exported hypothetical protein [Verrucomicrobiota bacterium]